MTAPFDFQKLIVYQKAKAFSMEMTKLIQAKTIDRVTCDQLKRASLSIPLNIAEGCSRISHRDRRNFFIIARGSTFECVAVLEHLFQSQRIEKAYYEACFRQLEEISRMLLKLIKNLS